MTHQSKRYPPIARSLRPFSRKPRLGVRLSRLKRRRTLAQDDPRIRRRKGARERQRQGPLISSSGESVASRVRMTRRRPRSRPGRPVDRAMGSSASNSSSLSRCVPHCSVALASSPRSVWSRRRTSVVVKTLAYASTACPDSRLRAREPHGSRGTRHALARSRGSNGVNDEPRMWVGARGWGVAQQFEGRGRLRRGVVVLEEPPSRLPQKERLLLHR